MASWLNIQYSDIQIEQINTRFYHLVAGNPIRYKGKIEVKYDNTWEYNLSEKIKNEINNYIDKYKL
ncbi:MAG: hypothetical protein ACOCWG_03430 [bacterium]